MFIAFIFTTAAISLAILAFILYSNWFQKVITEAKWSQKLLPSFFYYYYAEKKIIENNVTNNNVMHKTERRRIRIFIPFYQRRRRRISAFFFLTFTIKSEFSFRFRYTCFFSMVLYGKIVKLCNIKAIICTTYNIVIIIVKREEEEAVSSWLLLK